MSNAALEKLVEQIGAKGGLPWVRKTTFTPSEDGAYVRKIVLPDGTVEREETIPPERCEKFRALARPEQS
ncbi:hypothetical protein [Desulfonatronum thiodismutans]|uniref:hypothetical protein n=1 Tax=Desulfonatronum thiodismutans TaxID=159290 RepID=UPI0004ABD5CE|nr:hypothetical protein [Desulfonatronum thiodismutans]